MSANSVPGRGERLLALFLGVAGIAVLGIIDFGLYLLGQEVEP